MNEFFSDLNSCLAPVIVGLLTSAATWAGAQYKKKDREKQELCQSFVI